MDYRRDVEQLFADWGEECPVGEEFDRVVAAYKAGAEGGAGFEQSAKRFGIFQEFYGQVN
jgi:hypothetical protein